MSNTRIDKIPNAFEPEERQRLVITIVVSVRRSVNVIEPVDAVPHNVSRHAEGKRVAVERRDRKMRFVRPSISRKRPLLERLHQFVNLIVAAKFHDVFSLPLLKRVASVV